MTHTRAFCLWGLVWVSAAAGACQIVTPPTAGPTIAATARATLSATPDPTPAPTRGPLRVWASPALPDRLWLASLSVQAIGEWSIEWVEDPESAEVRIGPDPERPLSNWVYAAVAPFPTVVDGLSTAEIAESWSAGTEWIVAPAVADALSGRLGATSAARVPAAELLEAAWSSRPMYAIIPFEELDPRWKVLEIDGQSPIRKDFLADSYPLSVEFGLSGDPAGMDALQGALDWPASNRDPEKLTVLVMTGVTALVRATAWRMDRYGAEYPGLQIGGWLREADLAHVSHEAAFNPDCPPPEPFSSSLRFCANPAHAALFDSLGVDLVELTGNHLQDYGPDPLRFTLDLYAQLGLQIFGGGADLERAREPVLVEHHGNRLAFLGCNAAGPRGDWAAGQSPGALSCQDEGLLDQVTGLRDRGYLVVFTFQWPESVSPYPQPEQVEAFRAAADAGADIVNGSQAHRPQGMEFYAGSFIHYGLGNLFFDQMHALALRQEFLDRHVFYEGRHISIELLTALLEDYAQPRPMDLQERSGLLLEMFAVSGW